MYSHFVALGFDVALEDSGSAGRTHLTVKSREGVYLFEVKVEGTAVQRIKAKDCADKYRGKGHPVWPVAVQLSGKGRNVEGFETERVQ